MSSVPKSIYFGADQGVRRGVKKRLLKAAEQRAKLVEQARELRLKGLPNWKSWENHKTGANETLAQMLEIKVFPIELLACPECGRPTMQCRCLDAQGAPLDWSRGGDGTSAGGMKSPAAPLTGDSTTDQEELLDEYFTLGEGYDPADYPDPPSTVA